MVSALTATNPIDLAAAIEALEAQYVAENPTSRLHFQSARASLPGANTRSPLHYDPFPVFIDWADGSRVVDVDGHEYLDFMNDLTAGFYGHSNPKIMQAIRSALAKGINLGGPHVHETALAAAICDRFCSIERVRFCNSGTEANLIAMGLARAITGRPLIMAFKGAYHGSLANYLDLGAPLNVDKRHMRFARYNDIEDVRRCFSNNASRLAAIIVEPMIGSGGGILADEAFLGELRALANENKCLLIFDEVQTARFDPGGLQTLMGICPDITTLGKSLGGGLNFGALGGSAEIMDRFDPSRADCIAHGGTFNNNVLTMVAGKAGLQTLASRRAIHRSNRRGSHLSAALANVASRTGMPLALGGFGSIVSLHFQADLPKHPGNVKTGAPQRKLFQLFMLLNGFYVTRRGTINLSLQTTRGDCEAFVDTFAQFADQYGQLCAVD